MIGVAIIEDHPLSRQGLVRIIDGSIDMELVATASSVQEFEDAGYERIRVVLVDFHLPDAEGADAVSRVKACVEAVLVISASSDHQSVLDAIGAGANGYLKKGANSGEIVKAVTAVAQGGAYVSPMLAAHLLRHARETSGQPGLAVTDRDLDILSLVAQGETDASIASQLSVSVDTVRPHLDRIRREAQRRLRTPDIA
ncbi:MAG TPA: response regulator transcription factor [Acidimicrobiales bacterium]|nr:response regulator transcription factor [Acidimicrobiales bacterium]